MTATLETTIREIVATDYRTAAVFQRHGVDFCCNGCRTVEQGCRDARADERVLLREIDAVLSVEREKAVSLQPKVERDAFVDALHAMVGDYRK